MASAFQAWELCSSPLVPNSEPFFSALGPAPHGLNWLHLLGLPFLPFHPQSLHHREQGLSSPPALVQLPHFTDEDTDPGAPGCAAARLAAFLLQGLT